jgi:hypothetical protein
MGCLTDHGEAESCEPLRVQQDRMIVLRCQAQVLTETTPFQARSCGPTDAATGLHRRHCGAIKSPGGELRVPRPGEVPLKET